MNLILPVAFGFLATSFNGYNEEKKMETVPQIKAVEYDVSKTNPLSLTVKVTGEVKSLGYTEPKLTRVTYVKPPADGVQDYTMTAIPPDGPSGQALSEVSAEDTWTNFEKNAPWLKGVRIKGIGQGEKVVWIKSDVVVKNGETTGKAKVGQIVEIQVQYPVVPPFPSDFEVKIDGKTVPLSETSAPVLVNGRPVTGAGLKCVRFPVETNGQLTVTVNYKRGNDKLTTDVKLDVSK